MSVNFEQTNTAATSTSEQGPKITSVPNTAFKSNIDGESISSMISDGDIDICSSGLGDTTVRAIAKDVAIDAATNMAVICQWNADLNSTIAKRFSEMTDAYNFTNLLFSTGGMSYRAMTIASCINDINNIKYIEDENSLFPVTKPKIVITTDVPPEGRKSSLYDLTGILESLFAAREENFELTDAIHRLAGAIDFNDLSGLIDTITAWRIDGDTIAVGLPNPESLIDSMVAGDY